MSESATPKSSKESAVPKGSLVHLHTFCHSGDCCPELHEDLAAPPEKRFIITDDFGGSIQLSREDLVAILTIDPAKFGITISS